MHVHTDKHTHTQTQFVIPSIHSSIHSPICKTVHPSSIIIHLSIIHSFILHLSSLHLSSLQPSIPPLCVMVCPWSLCCVLLCVAAVPGCYGRLLQPVPPAARHLRDGPRQGGLPHAQPGEHSVYSRVPNRHTFPASEVLWVRFGERIRPGSTLQDSYRGSYRGSESPRAEVVLF